MTVSTSTSRIEYTGDAVTTVFSFPYYFLANGDLKVYLDGVLQTITTHYTVAGAGVGAGGTVTFLAAPPNGDVVVIYREVAITQAVDYTPNDPFPANTHEQALDRLTMIAQQLKEAIDRALSLPSTSIYSALTLPDPIAGYYLKWKSDLSGLENVSAYSGPVEALIPTTFGTVEVSKAVVVDANKDATGFRKITGSTSTGITASFTYTGTTSSEAAVYANVTQATGNTYAFYGLNASATGAGVVGYASHPTGANKGIYGETASNAGYAGYFTATVAGGIPIRCVSADAADVNHSLTLSKGARSINLNPRASVSAYNPIVEAGDQTFNSAGAGGAINTGVLTLAPYATDAVGIRIDSTDDSVDLVGTSIQINGLPIGSGALVYNAGTQSIPNAAVTALTWDSESYNNIGIHTASSSELIVPSGKSKIKLHGNINFASNATGYRQLVLYKNGAAFVGGSNIVVDANATTGTFINFSSPPLVVAAGDIFTMRAYQNSGGALNVGTAGSEATWFSMEIIQ